MYADTHIVDLVGRQSEQVLGAGAQACTRQDHLPPSCCLFVRIEREKAGRRVSIIYN